MIDDHWIVAWELPNGVSYRSEVLPHPAVHLVFEPTLAARVYGVQRQRYTRTLQGRGWALGTKFLPGGFAGLGGPPPHELVDRTFELGQLFGAAGADLAQRCLSAELRVEPTLAALYGLLRSGAPREPGPQLELVQQIVAEMRSAPPGTSVAFYAHQHHVSMRTLQRMFRDYVGVGPKWVLERYRIHDAIERLDRRQPVDWARFAIDLGYYDQAHFVRDFRALVGVTPGRYDTAIAAA